MIASRRTLVRLTRPTVTLPGAWDVLSRTVATLLLVLFAVGCGDNLGPAIEDEPAPAALSYSMTSAVYTRDLPIASNVPRVTGTVTSWSVTPSLPVGLALDPATGAITGTPSVAQAATQYIVTARNRTGATTATLSITINDAAPAALSYTTTSAVYTIDEEITPNVPTITGTVSAWSVSPALPAGLVLDAATGELRGTPTALQPATEYIVTATNTGGSTTATLSITINDLAPASLSYTTTSAVYTLGAVIAPNVPTVTGTVVSWSVDPALPAGLALDTSTGEITGTPTALQPATSYLVTATNSGGSTTATLSITVNDLAPTALSYGTTSAVYTLGVVVAPNTPTVTGTVVSWSVSPALPAGLTLDTTTGVISGTPSTLQNAATYTITATNSGGSTTATISITINDQAPTALSYTTVAAVYTRDEVIAPNLPTVTGSVVSWSVSPALPAGLTLNTTTGAITGTPSTIQTAASYTVTATNTGGSTTATLSITVNDQAPTALSYVTTSAVYTRDAVIASNLPMVTGTVVSWSVSPALPAGLVLDTTTGAISGTPSTVQAAAQYVVTATNSGGSTTATLSITVNDQAPTALSYGTAAAIYTRDVVIAANTPTVTGTVISWSVSPALPAGLTLDTTTGAITGTPSALQAATSYTITATNSGGSTTATLSITINDLAPSALAYDTTAAVYTRDAAIIANRPTVTGSVVSWSVSPALPAGLVLDTATGEISGTPSTVQAATSYLVTATNSGGSTTATLSITVNDRAPAALSYATTAAVYTRNVVVTPNLPMVTGTVIAWSVSPALPVGLTLDTTTGAITGTPSTIQTAVTYTITATNSGGSTTATLSITVNDQAPAALSYGTMSAVYTRDTTIAPNLPTVTGSVIAWSVSPALPAGLVLDTATGAITGTPTTLQPATQYTVTATNSGGSTTTTISITVDDQPPSALSYGMTSATYTQGVVIASNVPTVTGTVASWSVSPALPAGLVLDTTTGVISGTPTALQPATQYTVTATNSGGSTTATISIAVNVAPPSNLSYATPSATYTQAVVITTNLPTVTGSVVSWSVSPALPAGLVLDTTTGHISGTPTALQSATQYTVTATNASGFITTTISITVNEAPPAALSYAAMAPVYTLGVAITGNAPTVTGSVSAWSVSPALPAGLTLNTATGEITGTPSVLQPATPYVVTATNSAGFTTATISIAVNAAPPSALSYAAAAATYTIDEVITANAPTVTGSVESWSVSPALPAGLTLNTATGEITGTPTVAQAATPYVVTATNSAGSTTATITIAVTSLDPPVAHAIQCTFTTAGGGSADCDFATGDGSSTGEDNHTRYGGQHAVLAATGTSYNPGTSTFAFSTTLQNRLPQAIGTIDGRSWSPTGIRLVVDSIVVTGGTGGITVANAAGTGDFSKPNRPYFQLSDKLAQFEVSAPASIQLNVPSTVSQFKVYFEISTKVAVKLVINELFVNPYNVILDVNGEWFEVYNAGKFPVNMKGFGVGDSSASGDRPVHVVAPVSALMIQPGALLVFGGTTNTALNGGVPVDYAYGQALALANSLDAVRILSPDGPMENTPSNPGPLDVSWQSNPVNIEVARVWYKAAAISARDGFSRELIDTNAPSASVDGSAWSDPPATAVYGSGGTGTPGAPNSGSGGIPGG